MDEPLFLPSTSSSLFDTYLVYGIIALLVLIAILGLVILLSTSCCCCYCCVSPSTCASCFSGRRHSSYKLRQRSKHLANSTNDDSKKRMFMRRHPSDVADFSQLYDSCPHLINSRAMAPAGANMDTSCTTIDTIVSPVSPCSSFRSFVGSGTLPKEIKVPMMQNDLSKLPLPPPPPPLLLTQNSDKPNNAPPPSSSSAKDACSRPFSYIKNTNDRAQILRRLTPQERSIPIAAIPLDVTRLPSLTLDDTNQPQCNSTNIYETVLPTPIQPPPVEVPPPIYETEWTHSLRQLMLNTSTNGNEQPSSMDLPSAPPDLVPPINQSTDYFQQQNPYDKFLASRTSTSDSMRRTNMLRRLKDDAAFLY